jgi:uncharacterized protein YbaP (TraB family)
MQKSIFFLLGILGQLFSFPLAAKEKRNENQENVHSILWKISGNGLEKPSYLFGTIHLICNEDYFFNPIMKRTFDECEKLILEINLNDPKTITEYQQGMMLPKGKELKDFFLNVEEYQKFSEKLKKQTDIDVALFANLKPLILLSLIAQKSFECENTSSYEMNLLELAKERTIAIEGLETSISQMKVFDDMKDDEIKRILMEGIDDMEKDNMLQQRMIEAYKDQNIDRLYELILSSKEFQNQQDALINQRNKNWVEKLPLIMKEKSCFIAVDMRLKLYKIKDWMLSKRKS